MMVSFKGILKYLIYLFIAAWMFLLGIVVGRGTSPVTFDTQKFQERLEMLARKQDAENKPVPKKVDLEFYGALNHPIPVEGSPASKQMKEISPKKEVAIPEPEDGSPVPLLTSLKKKTYKSRPSKTVKPAPSPVSSSVNKTAEKRRQADAQEGIKTLKSKTVATKTKPKSDTPKPASGSYTIQIAAYENFKDAVSQMAALEKKGFASYRVKATIKGKTWYRVRTGSFSTHAQAKKMNERLKKAGIKSPMIIKKEQR